MRICADVGGSFIDLAAIDDDGRIVARDRRPTPTDDWAAFAAVFVDAQDRFGALVAPDTSLAIAIAGIVSDSGVVTASANIACIEGRAVGAELGRLLRRQVLVVNDADAFALAEAWLGVARGHDRVFGIVLGTGVGGALLEHGRLVSGPSGIAGEWGHGPLLRPSPTVPDAVPVFPCGCGRHGCLDTVGGARGMERLHEFLHGSRRSSIEIISQWIDGELQAAATVDYYSDLVSGPIAMLLNAFPATIVPLGGGLANATPLVTLLDEKIRAGLLRNTTAPILAKTTLGSNAGLLGAMIAGREPNRQARPHLVRHDLFRT